MIVYRIGVSIVRLVWRRGVGCAILGSFCIWSMIDVTRNVLISTLAITKLWNVRCVWITAISVRIRLSVMCVALGTISQGLSVSRKHLWCTGHCPTCRDLRAILLRLLRLCIWLLVWDPWFSGKWPLRTLILSSVSLYCSMVVLQEVTQKCSHSWIPCNLWVWLCLVKTRQEGEFLLRAYRILWCSWLLMHRYLVWWVVSCLFICWFSCFRSTLILLV